MMSPISALARSTWALSSRLPAVTVAPSCARRPGGSSGGGLLAAFAPALARAVVAHGTSGWDLGAADCTSGVSHARSHAGLRPSRPRCVREGTATTPSPTLPGDGTAADGRAPLDRDGADRRRDPRHERRRPRARPDAPRRGRAADHAPCRTISATVTDGVPRRPCDAPTWSSRPAASARPRTTSPARRSRRCVGETPAVDPALEAWLRDLFERRALPFPEANLKQAWLIPSADGRSPTTTARRRAGGCERPDGRLIVALPGPPREMRPMWDGWVLPRLAERGLGRAMASVTLRLTGIGESAIAARLGSLLDAGAQPECRHVCASRRCRHPHLDPRRGRLPRTPRRRSWRESSAEIVGMRRRPRLGARRRDAGRRRWPPRCEARGWRLAAVEIGLRGVVARAPRRGSRRAARVRRGARTRPAPHGGQRATLEHLAERVRELGAREVGVAVEARERGGDTAVTVAVVTPDASHRETPGRLPRRAARARPRRDCRRGYPPVASRPGDVGVTRRRGPTRYRCRHEPGPEDECA